MKIQNAKRTTTEFAIPYEHRQAMTSIDVAIGQDICEKTAKLSAKPVPFAEACFYFLDAVGDGPIDVVKFCNYLKENGCPGQSRFVLATMLREKPTIICRIYG